MRLPRISYKLIVVLFFSAFSVFAEFSSTDSSALSTIKSLVSTINTRGSNLYNLLDTFTSSNLLELRSIGGKLTDIDQYSYGIKSNSELIYSRLVDIQNLLTNLDTSHKVSITNTVNLYPSITNFVNLSPVITNNVNPVFSITNIVNQPSIVITNDVNPIFNITNDVNPSFSITNNLNNFIVVSNFVNIASTNQVAGEPIDYATLLANLGLYTSLSTVEKSYSDILGVVSNRPYAVDLSPYYYASSGLWLPLVVTRGDGLKFKNYLSSKVSNSGSYDFSTLISNISGYSRQIDNTPSDSSNNDDSSIFDSYTYQSFLVNEMLFGTADIENMFADSTNHIAEISKIGPRIDNLEVLISNGFETIVLTLHDFTNIMQNVSVSSLVNSNQFAQALQDSADTMPAAFTDTSIASISNATVYATEDNGYSTLLNQNAIDETSFDYSRFETSVRSFVQVWQSGVNVGSPTLNIHFVGVDTGEGNPTLEQTIDLDFELPQSAKDKIGAFWSAVFALIRGSLILWGFFRLFNAVLNANRRESSSGHTDFTNVDVD